MSVLRTNGPLVVFFFFFLANKKPLGGRFQTGAGGDENLNINFLWPLKVETLPRTCEDIGEKLSKQRADEKSDNPDCLRKI